MKETRFFYAPNAASQNQLPTEEATHAIRVLRIKPGDEFFLMDGQGSFHRAEVESVTSKHCFYRLTETLPQQPAWHGRIHLAIAPTKDAGRMEWLAEKAVEIGIDEISFLECRFSERRTMRTERIERIVVSAMKQSRKPWKPQVNPMIPFNDFIARAHPSLSFICHCYNEIPRADLFTEITKPQESQSDITILVGPEGDFSIDEVNQAMDCGFISATLGQSRLRTETAGLSAVVYSQLARRILD